MRIYVLQNKVNDLILSICPKHCESEKKQMSIWDLPIYRKYNGSGMKRIFLAHLAFRPYELLPSLFVRRPSVNISHFNLLLRNHMANCNQTLVEWSLGGTLPKLCPVIPTSNKDGCQAKNRKKGGWNVKKKSSPLKLRSQSQPNFAEMILGWSPSKIVSGISNLWPGWPPQPNLI
jgi:hypothetical protein